MASPKTNAIVDILAGISFFFSALSGLVLKFILPRGSGKLGETVIGLYRENWLSMHDTSSIIFIILIIIHLVLHWKWILCIPKFFKKNKRM
jgi:hypothetical protein